MQTFSVRDLREHAGDLIHGAEEGRLALITKHSKPIFLAVPFNDVMIENGVQIAVAVEMYRSHVVSLGKASKIAKISIEEFIEKASAFGISVVDYPPEEIEDELLVLNKRPKKK